MTPPASDAVVDVGDLADLYRVRAERRVPLRLHDLSLVVRAVRREVARTVLECQLPALVAELLAAANDDLSEAPPSDAEALADAELRVIESVEQCKAVLDAVALDALARLEADIEAGERARFADLGRPKPPGWVDADDLTVLEVSTATGLGQQEVHARLGLATGRTAGAADLRSRLRRGTVSLYRACTIASEIAALPADLGPSIIESTLRPKDDAPPSPTLFRQRLTRACLAADREAALRRRRARRQRGAHARIDADGLGVLTVVTDTDKVIAAMERADSVARAARRAGDPRTLDALRADVITDALVFGGSDLSHRGRPDGPGTSADSSACCPEQVVATAAGTLTNVGRRPPAHVTIVVPFTTAVGLTDAPCEVPGYGWVTAEHARQIMLNDDSTWRRLLVDAETGRSLQLETTAYRPTAAMRAHVEALDGTCRGPGCTIPAVRCDLDHDIPWPHGPTEVGNLTSKHRPHHTDRLGSTWGRAGRSRRGRPGRPRQPAQSGRPCRAAALLSRQATSTPPFEPLEPLEPLDTDPARRRLARRARPGLVPRGRYQARFARRPSG
jgi:hypothetical protein